MVALMDDKISANAIGRKISSLRSFYKYLQCESILSINPMLLIRAPKVPKRLPVFIEEHKLDQLLDSETIFTADFSSKRDKIVLELLSLKMSGGMPKTVLGEDLIMITLLLIFSSSRSVQPLEVLILIPIIECFAFIC